ncbi:MAG: hypothetical protein KAT12_00765 [Gammaproteobacteria bacterium]|nr:hypothetical protein [Gammaproteobacteria bacterium]
MALMLCQLLIATNTHATNTWAAAASATSYSIVLASAPGKNLKWAPEKSHLFKGRTIYVERTMIKNAPWERLYLGFFDSRKQAASPLKKIQQIYPGAWIQQSPTKNTTVLVRPGTSDTRIKTALQTNTSSLTKKQLSDKQLDSLMQRARQDFKNKRYSSAIRYLIALLSAGEHQHSRDALELLGLARQRKGQKSHAVDAYEKYLARYPDGDTSDRVRQRLAGLLTAASTPDKVRMSTVEDRREFTSYGSLAQFYRSNTTAIDNAGSTTTQQQLTTFLDLTTQQRTTNFDHRYQFTADHNVDFIDSSDDSEFRFVETYYEISDRKTGTSGRIGRQPLRIGGTLRRFDGLSAGYQFTPEMRLNIVAGLPIDIDNKSSFNKHKTFYGLTYEIGTLFDHWDINLFYFDQQVDGLTDRNSAGTEVRYRDKTKSLFGMIDYDIFYDEVNIFQLNASILLEHGRTAYMNAFLHKTPLLSTSNALIGRQERTIEELKTVLNIEQIYQLARDRTTDSQTVTLGGSQPLSKKYQVTADITFARVGDTIASGGVPATTATDTDYFISTQLVGNSLLRKYDTGVLGLRYYSTTLSDTTSLIVNARFPVTRHWRINPRLQFNIRKSSDGRSQKKLRAIFKTDYRYLNKARFDLELGYDEISEDNNGQSLDINNLFFMLGYRWDF